MKIIFNSFFSRTSFIILFLFFFCHFSIAQWTKKDKTLFYEAIQAVPDLSNLGEKKDVWIDCYFKKCEATYATYEDADSDIDGCKKLAIECSKEIFSSGSKRGEWSELDKKQFYKDMQEVKELESLEEKKSAWIDCYFSKCQKNFSSYLEANSDQEGCKRLAFECNDEVLK
jgi:hypothetical protein